VPIVQGVTALEMGPRGDADVTSNIFEAVEAGPVLYHSSEQPADGRPLLHVAAPHHQLSQPAVQQVMLRPGTAAAVCTVLSKGASTLSRAGNLGEDC
jgi:hypothetical protein